MRARILAIQNSEHSGPGLLAKWLSAEGVDLDILKAYAGEELPARVDAHGLLVLGGAPSPRDDAAGPWFPGLRRLLASAVDDQVPTLGICLGHQMLAMACGGDAGPTRGEVEVGIREVQVDRAATADDPLFGELPESVPVVESHQDEVWKPPPGAVPLASTPGCRHQAYRIGPCAWGVQFHPEVLAPRYVASAQPGNSLLAEIGEDRAEVEAACKAAAPRLIATWRPFAERFAQVVRRHASAMATPNPGGALARGVSEIG